MKIRLPLSSILLDESTQCREKTDPALVEEYAAAYRREEVLPPPDVFGALDEEESLPDGAKVWIGDGHTRVRGALAADLAFLTCEVHLGGEEEAFAFALRANRHHGARITNADKRCGIRKALARWPGLSSREIAARCGVDHKTVESVRQESTGELPQLEREGADGKKRRLPQRPAQEQPAPYAPQPRDRVTWKPDEHKGTGHDAEVVRWDDDEGSWLIRVTAKGTPYKDVFVGAEELTFVSRPAAESASSAAAAFSGRPATPAGPLFNVGMGGAAQPFTERLFAGAPTDEEAAASLGVKLTPELAAFGAMFEGAAQTGPLRTAGPGATTIVEGEPDSSSFAASNEVEKEETSGTTEGVVSASPPTAGPTGTLIGVGPPSEEAPRVSAVLAGAAIAAAQAERDAALDQVRDLETRAEQAEARVRELEEQAEELRSDALDGDELTRIRALLSAAEHNGDADHEVERLLARVAELEAELALERGASCGACELAAERIKDLQAMVRRLEARAERLSAPTERPEVLAGLLEGGEAPAPLRVALVGCGAMKLDHAAPARELYTGPLFRAALAYAEDEAFDAIFVLSAKHGFVQLHQRLEPYDVALEGLSEDERKLLGALVVRDLAQELEGEPAEVTVLAAEGYVGLLDGAPWKVHAPLAGLGIGERLAWFKQQREEAPAGLEELPPVEGESAGALSVKCPQCRAAPGAKCKNYKGKGQAPHRKRTDAAKKGGA